MVENSTLESKLAKLPKEKLEEVNDFVDFLLKKVESNKKKPQFGSGKGMFVISPDFDEPLEDFKDYM
ncbi:MAG: DUF2281 domain-containing protein [Cyclobacteriaceae bacterium]|nr:DUF2281 domain-containing protein [Cyclobacteriaceae bacterium]